MKGGKAEAGGLTLGGEPRIDFLPAEVKAKKKARRTRRSLVALVIMIVAVCIAGYIYAAGSAALAEGELDAARERALALIAQQGEFNEVREVTGKIASATIAQKVGSAPEILWGPFLDSVVGVLPSGAVIDSYTVASPLAAADVIVPGVPLQNPGVATVRFEVTLVALDDAKALLKNLATLNGYADAWTNSIVLADDGAYTASFNLNVNGDVLAKRFFPDVADSESTAPSSTEATEGNG